jgi:tetratricopeptide (TPR) repeat protein
MVYSKLKNPEEAISYYSKAIENNSDYIEAYNYRGLAKTEQGKYKEAIEDYTKALSIDSTYAMAYYNRGISKVSQNKFSNGCQDFYNALDYGFEPAKKMIDTYCRHHPRKE